MIFLFIKPPEGVPKSITILTKKSTLKIYRRGTVKSGPKDTTRVYIPEGTSRDIPRKLALETESDWKYRENVEIPIKSKQRPPRVKYMLEHESLGKWYIDSVLKKGKLRGKKKEINSKLKFAEGINSKFSGIILIIINNEIKEEINPDSWLKNIAFCYLKVGEKND